MSFKNSTILNNLKLKIGLFIFPVQIYKCISSKEYKK